MQGAEIQVREPTHNKNMSPLFFSVNISSFPTCQVTPDDEVYFSMLRFILPCYCGSNISSLWKIFYDVTIQMILLTDLSKSFFNFPWYILLCCTN